MKTKLPFRNIHCADFYFGKMNCFGVTFKWQMQSTNYENSNLQNFKCLNFRLHLSLNGLTV